MRSEFTISKLTLVGAALIACFSTSFAAPSTCPVGYTMGFFNGVGNTFADALNGLNALKIRTMAGADAYNGEDVKYEVYYNTTGSQNGSTVIQDVAEVFAQRAVELDPSGTVSGNNFYLFWDTLEGVSGTGYSNTVATSSPAFNTLLQAFQTSTINAELNVLVALLVPPTLSDYAAQQAQLDAEVAAGRKLVLVAHSQGNLFVNQAYNYVQPQIGSNLVKVVHVAPASPKLNGQWVLANIDLVINGLRLKQGFSTVPDVNLILDDYGADPSGHTLLGTYLDRTRDGLAATQALVTAAFAAISPAPCALTVTPANSRAQAGDNIALVAALTTPVTDPDAVVTYQWSVSGTAAGMVADPVTGTISTSFESSSAKTTYIASPNAVNGLQDTVTVTAYLGNLLDSTAHKAIGNAKAAVSFGGTTVNVVVTQPWTDTGLVVTQGQPLTLKASGLMDYWSTGCPASQNCNVTPDGTPACSSPSDSTAPGLPCNSLIGRIGQNGVPFEVGSALTYTVPTGVSGELFLGVDDNNLSDNTGTWTAVIN